MINKIMVVGNVTREPKLEQTSSGISVCKFGLAVPRDRGDETDFFNVVAWRNQADSCAKFVHKGSMVGVVGRLEVHTFESQDGSKRTSVDINLENVQFIKSPKSGDNPMSKMTPVENEDGQLPF